MTSLPESPPPSPAAGLVEMCHELALCGWTEQADARLGELAHFQTYQGAQAVPIRRLVNSRGEALALFSMEGVSLPADQELFERFLDLSLEVRMVLTLARHAGEARWVLILTRERVDLYQLPEETRLAVALSREEWDGELLPVLAALARGKGAGSASQGRQLPGAESLGQWLRHWSSQLGAAAQLPVDAVGRVLWQWILMLQVDRRADSSEAGGRWGLTCELQAEGWRVSYEALSATEDMSRHLLHFEDYFSSRLFETDRQDLAQRLERIEETSLMDRLRAELLMQSQDRFEPETVAWLFTDLDREQEGWRREVAGVEPVRHRLAHDGWTIYQPLVCDVGRHGLAFALREAGRLAHYLNDVDQFMRQRRQADPDSPAGQPDLFRPNPRGIGATGLLDDGLNYLFAEALRLRGVGGEARLGVGITFLLKALALSGELQWPFLGIDTLDGLFLNESQTP